MDLIKSIRCLLCLAKCSKYLYFAKKAICIVTLLITAVLTLNVLRGKKISCLLKGMM